MPIYEYECEECGTVQEKIFKVKNCPNSVKCRCGRRAKKIISAKLAVITDNNASWIPSVVHQMKPDYDKKPVETRLELKNYLSEHGLCWTG